MSDSGRKNPRWLPFAIISLILTILTILIVVMYMVNFISKAPSTSGKNLEFVVMPNTNFDTIATNLQAQGLTTDARRLKIIAAYRGQHDKIKSGRYLLSTGWTPIELLDFLVSGVPVLDRITIPEGLTWWETGKRLAEAGFVNLEDFKAVIHDKAYLRHWGIPGISAEGYLFPDTYLFMRPLVLNQESAKIIVNRMVDTFWRRTMPLWRAEGSLTPSERQHAYQAVTLASIVEKETSLPGERARVAGVFANRLRLKMMLQADPTIIYGIGPDFDGNIRRRDIENSDNKYNTYRHTGLTPSPICSPGLAAIRAATNPEEHNFIYFVAIGDGGHMFSKTLEEHNRAVRMFVRKLKD